MLLLPTFVCLRIGVPRSTIVIAGETKAKNRCGWPLHQPSSANPTRIKVRVQNVTSHKTVMWGAPSFWKSMPLVKYGTAFYHWELIVVPLLSNRRSPLHEMRADTVCVSPGFSLLLIGFLVFQ